MQRIFLAIDIGASSGRHIVGIEADGALQTDEVYRFPNGMQRENGHLIWDIEGIFQHVKAGIKAAFAKYPHIDNQPSLDSATLDASGGGYVGKVKKDADVVGRIDIADRDRTLKQLREVYGPAMDPATGWMEAERTYLDMPTMRWAPEPSVRSPLRLNILAPPSSRAS